MRICITKYATRNQTFGLQDTCANFIESKLHIWQACDISISNIHLREVFPQIQLMKGIGSICMSEIYACIMHFSACIVHNIYSRQKYTCKKYMHIRNVRMSEIYECKKPIYMSEIYACIFRNMWHLTWSADFSRLCSLNKSAKIS